jgi:predicted nucleic acid-binding protein
MIVVTNTTPLILLAKCGLFALLQRFYGQLLLPPAVWQEVVEEGEGRAGQQETAQARTAGWVTVRDPQDRAMVQRFRDTFRLGAGESEVMALARECAADLVLLDDERAVQRARELGCVVRRTPGILAFAKEQGLIVSVQEHLAVLRAEGLWLSAQAYDHILRDVGEKP